LLHHLSLLSFRLPANNASNVFSLFSNLILNPGGMIFKETD
jgi:hypothetical protein